MLRCKNFDWWNQHRGARVIAEKVCGRWRFWEKNSTRWIEFVPSLEDCNQLRRLKRREASRPASKGVPARSHLLTAAPGISR